MYIPISMRLIYTLPTVIIYNFVLRFFISILTSYFKRMTRLKNSHFSDGWLELNILKNAKYSSQEKGFFIIFFICRWQKMVECFIHEWLLFTIHHHIFPLLWKEKIILTNTNKHLSCSCEIVKKWMSFFLRIQLNTYLNEYVDAM